jgi:hypothetical protein|eukprot:COSAG01_NODE_147_length_24095_cov_25.855428_12_plen_45_part_00
MQNLICVHFALRSSVIASQFLLTDEILKAGKKMGKGTASMPGMG